MKSRKLLVFGLAVVFCCLLPAVAHAMNLEEAAKASRESGRPLLIVAGRHTCGITMAVLGHLKEPAIGPALTPYVNVFVDVDGEEGHACEKKFGHPGDMLPFVYVVRADGEKLYSHSGMLASNEIREMLVSELAKAGKNLSAKDTAVLKKALEEARRAQKSGDLGEAVRSLLPLKKIGPLGSISCFTGPGLEANQLVAQLTDEGKKMLKKVDDECADGKPTLDAMLTYVKARRSFTLLPTLKTELAGAARKYDHRQAFTEVLAQAEALDRARRRPPPTMPRRRPTPSSGSLPTIPIRKRPSGRRNSSRSFPAKGPKPPLPASRSPPIEPGPTPRATSPSRPVRPASKTIKSRWKPRTVGRSASPSRN